MEVASLEPFPDNPNRGDLEAVRASFDRFGQVHPIVVDGARIVAGHTRVEVALEKEWTHIAAVPNDFGSEEEQRAFLLADNRTSELGRIDDELLSTQLAALRDLRGTGYTAEDAADLEARLAELRAPSFPPSDEPPPALDSRSPTTGLFEVPLLLGKEERADFARLVRVLEREWNVEGVAAVVVRAVREAAMRA